MFFFGPENMFLWSRHTILWSRNMIFMVQEYVLNGLGNRCFSSSRVRFWFRTGTVLPFGVDELPCGRRLFLMLLFRCFLCLASGAWARRRRCVLAAVSGRCVWPSGRARAGRELAQLVAVSGCCVRLLCLAFGPGAGRARTKQLVAVSGCCAWLLRRPGAGWGVPGAG